MSATTANNSANGVAGPFSRTVHSPADGSAIMSRMRLRRPRVLLLLAILAWAAGARPAAAHPAPFSYLDLVFRNGGIDGTLVIHTIDAAHELSLAPPDTLLDPAVL